MKPEKRSRYFVPISIIAVLTAVFIAVYSSENRPAAPEADGTFTLFLSGDALMSQSWSSFTEPAFTGLIDEVRAADAAITNLEMLIHDYEGFAQASSGGTYMRAGTEIVGDLVLAGFDMVSNANNHTFDYGSEGILKTLEYIRDGGLKIAGAGKDLQEARSAVYYDSPDGRVALLSVTSSFTDYGRASRARPDIHGRPGLNPLTVERVYTIDERAARALYETAHKSGVPVREPRDGRFSMFGRTFTVGGEYGSSYRMDERDLQENLAAVREAAENADYVIMSVHSHQNAENYRPEDFYVEFAHACIDNGADIVFGHGPHYIKGIEIYNGKPILYSLGNLVFQNETITKQPVEFYERYGLGDGATIEEAYDARTTTEKGVDTRSFPAQRHNWESVVAALEYSGESLNGIRLIPIDLQWKEPRGVRGRPLLADKELGKYLIDQLIERSAPFGTEVVYNGERNIGIVTLK